MMGIISGSVLQHGGSVTAVVPAAMLRSGEGESWIGSGRPIELEEKGREKVMSLYSISSPGTPPPRLGYE
jgi:hypothetical protein